MATDMARPLWERIKQSRAEIRSLARRHHARRISVFGSVARGEEAVPV
ncbi:MAG: hypothetical protein ACRDPW_07670 [Mycobacteriales bacterium]